MRVRVPQKCCLLVFWRCWMGWEYIVLWQLYQPVKQPYYSYLYWLKLYTNEKKKNRKEREKNSSKVKMKMAFVTIPISLNYRKCPWWKGNQRNCEWIIWRWHHSLQVTVIPLVSLTVLQNLQSHEPKRKTTYCKEWGGRWSEITDRPTRIPRMGRSIWTFSLSKPMTISGTSWRPGFT